MVRQPVVRSVKIRQTLFTVNSSSVLAAVYTNTAANHFSTNIDAEVALLDVGAVPAFVSMTMALAFLAAILFLRCSGSERLLIVQWTASFTVFSARVVHALTLWQLAGALIVFVEMFATFAGVAKTVAATLGDNRLDRVVAALLQVIIVRRPLHRSLAFNFTDILYHACEENS